MEDINGDKENVETFDGLRTLVTEVERETKVFFFSNMKIVVTSQICKCTYDDLRYLCDRSKKLHRAGGFGIINSEIMCGQFGASESVAVFQNM